MKDVTSRVIEHRLDAFQFRETVLIPKPLTKLDVEQAFDPEYLGEHLRATMTAYIYGHSATQTVVHRAPADWWQHLKQRFAPAWVLRRWPVREKEQRVVVEALRLFPEFVPPRVGEPVCIIREWQPSWSRPW